jgi:hypothetical protein
LLRKVNRVKTTTAPHEHNNSKALLSSVRMKLLFLQQQKYSFSTATAVVQIQYGKTSEEISPLTSVLLSFSGYS